ncbi:MAG: hypothetical protein QOD77_1050 [Thermoplasmata archaeon]|nr:hypothetical protein [Thermoplasmata archaeon]
MLDIPSVVVPASLKPEGLLGRPVPPPEAHVRLGSCDILLVGTIAGFAPDAARVQAAFASHRPDRVALGVPPEDLEAVRRLATDPAAKAELVEPDLASEHLLRLLERFGPTKVPSPDLEAAHDLAAAHGAELTAIDIPDDAHAEVYTKRVKMHHVLRSNRREKKLLVARFEDARDPYELVEAWDREQTHLRPLREIEELREGFMAAKLRELSSKSERLLAIVPAARLEAVADHLRG